MPSELAAWLRRQREDRGWTRTEMARQIMNAAKAAGDRSVPGLDSMCHNLYRWERGADGLSERYKLYYSRALGIPPSQFGPSRHDQPPESRYLSQALPLSTTRTPPATPHAQASYVELGAIAPPLLPSMAIAYRGIEEPETGRFHIEHEVLMAAHEGSDHAEEFEQHGIGEATFEQLHADLARLSRLCDAGEPFAAFLDMRRVRSRVYRLLDRRQWPREQAGLFFLLGCINGLMGVAAQRLGYPDAAEELNRAGWAYANAIDHGRLRATLRVKLSANMYWRGWFGESRDLAADGLLHVTRGPLAADLHLNYARSAARLGDPGATRRAIGLAQAANDSGYSDDLVEIGGEEFRLSQPTQHTMAAHAFLELSDGDHEAVAELERAISLYDEGPVPGERSWFGGKALASTDLALVRLRSGALDAAVAALQPVLILPPAQRVSNMAVRLARVRDELAAPVFHGSQEARDLHEQIDEFGRDAVTAGLHSLTG